MKKIFSHFVVVLLLLTIVTNNVYAIRNSLDYDDCPEAPTEATDYIEESYQKPNSEGSIILEGAIGISDDELQNWLENNEKETVTDDEYIPLRTAVWIYTRDSSYGFYYYAQEQEYSCGPACVRMALKGLSNLVLTESEIRTGCNMGSTGTNIANMTAYMNNKQNDYVYDNKHSILASLFHTNMYNAVTSGAPPIVGIRITDPDDWFYTTTGHFIACYGIMSDKSKYALADPGAGYVGEPNWRWYNKTAGVLWDAYSSSLGYIA